MTNQVIEIITFTGCVFLNNDNLKSAEMGCVILEDREGGQLRLVNSRFVGNTAPLALPK